MENLPHLPDFVTEQRESAADPTFNAQLVEIAQRFASQEKRVIFISRAWPYENDRLGVKEEWSVPFVDMLYDHLQLLGFHVLLDRRDLGVGVQLDDAMKTSVDKADHVLMLVTRTYIHKAMKVPTSGVAREVHYITHKVEAMDPEGINGWVIAGKRRFVLPLAFNDTRGFPIADSHPGVATIFVQNAGYRDALIDLATKVYGVEPTLLRQIIPSHVNVLIQAVKKCYQEKKYIPRPFHDEPLPIEKGYVRLAIVKETEQEEKMKNFSAQEHKSKSDTNNVKLFEDKRLTSFEQIYGAKEPVDIGNIFKPIKDEKNKHKIPKRLLVLGRAGIGKSTLCQKIAHQWATLGAEEKLWEENAQEKFKLVVWLPLRNLLDYPEDATLSDVILKECVSKDQTGEKSVSKNAVIRGLKELKPDEILYVCDGYDEVAGRTTSLIDEILAKENVFVTTRPHGINQYLTSEHARPFDRKFENIGFLDEDIENYIKAFFGNEEARNYAESLIQFLKAHPNISGIAHIPINLMLICVAWKDNYKQLKPKEIKNVTITDLYYGLLINLGRRFLDKNKAKGLNDFTSEDILEDEKCKPVLAVLSELAFQQMNQESLLISGKALAKAKLRKKHPDVPSLRDDVIHFGLLSPTSTETNNEKTEFYFVHLTFQEFLAAFYIAEKLRKNDEEIKEYILTNKYSLRYEMVWWFLAGLLKDEIEVLEMFFDILESEPRDLAQIYHQMLLMRCMDECQLKISAPRKDRYISELGRMLTTNNNWCVTFCYKTFLAYSSLSSNVFSDSLMIEILKSELNQDDQYKTRRIIGLLQNHQRLTESILKRIAGLLNDSNIITVQAAIDFFTHKEIISADIENGISAITENTEEIVRKAACRFFCARKIVMKSTEERISARLEDPDEGVVVQAIEFFGTREEVSNKIQARIVSFVTGSGNVTDDAAVKFFGASKSISQEVVSRVVVMLKSPVLSDRKAAFKLCSVAESILAKVESHVITMLFGTELKLKNEAIMFFASCKKVSRTVEDYLEKLLTDVEWQVRYRVVSFFSGRKRLSQEIENHIAAMLFDPNNRIKVHVARFFQFRPKVSVNVQKSIALWLTNSEEELKIAAIDFFGSQEDILPVVEGNIEALLCDSSEEVRVSAIKFFSERPSVPEGVEKKMEAYLVEPDYCDFRKDVIDFFCGRKMVSKKVESIIADLLSDPDEYVSGAAIKFFSTREEVLEEVQQSIAGLLVSSDPLSALAAWVRREHVVEFFLTRKKVSEALVGCIADLFLDPGNIALFAATKFLCSQEDVSQKVFEIIGSVLPEGHTVDLLREMPISRILKCINQMSKENISKYCIKVFACKLLMANMPLYQVDDVCLQVDESCQITFNSQNERVNFCENFRKSLQSSTSYIFGLFSDADALASVGLLPAPPPNSNNTALSKISENNKRCVIC